MGNRTCAEPECGEQHYCRGYCMKHYNWHKRQGHIPNRPADPADRFWSYVDRGGPIPDHRPDLGPCWIFSPHRDLSVYRKFEFNGKSVPTHRLGYELQVGPIPGGLVIDHLCRTPGCVRGSHLEPVPQSINIERGRLREAVEPYYRRGAKITHCPQGHEFTAANSYYSPQGYRSCRECKRVGDAIRWRTDPTMRARNTENARRRRERLRADKRSGQTAA